MIEVKIDEFLKIFIGLLLLSLFTFAGLFGVYSFFSSDSIQITYFEFLTAIFGLIVTYVITVGKLLILKENELLRRQEILFQIHKRVKKNSDLFQKNSKYDDLKINYWFKNKKYIESKILWNQPAVYDELSNFFDCCKDIKFNRERYSEAELEKLSKVNNIEGKYLLDEIEGVVINVKLIYFA